MMLRSPIPIPISLSLPLRTRAHKTTHRPDFKRSTRKLPQITIMDKEGRWDKNSEDEHLWWPRVMWIDPGTVSGVAVIWFDPVALFAQQKLALCILAYSETYLSGPENGPNGQINRFLRLRSSLSGEAGLATGCESFTSRRADMSYEYLSPVRIRAGLEARMSVMPEAPTLHTQEPNDALNSFTNDRLTFLRMYTPGPDHINDAKRHGLLWIRKLVPKGREHFDLVHGTEDGWWS